jgi:anti-sigma factor RsiW
MSLSITTKLQLMAYTDGELSDAEVVEVEALLSRSVEARQIVSAIAEPAIGEFVRANEAARESPSVVDAVMARIDSECGPKSVPESVPESAPERATQPSNVISFASRKRSDRVTVAVVTVTTIAAMAASALVYVGSSRFSATQQPASSGGVAAAVSAELGADGIETLAPSPAVVSVLAMDSDQAGPGLAAATLLWFPDADDDDEGPGGAH